MLNVLDGVGATCLDCGLDIAKDVGQYRAMMGVVPDVIHGFVHEVCPSIIDGVPSLKTRKYDADLVYIRDALKQNCARCAHKKQTPYMIIDRDTWRVIRVCEECVRL